MALSNVRSGLVAAIDDIAGLRVYGKWPNLLKTPAAIVRRVRSTRHTTFSGNGSHRFVVTAIVEFADMERAQVDLDEYTDIAGTKSILAAIEAVPALGGNAEYVLVGDWGEDGEITYNNKPFLAAELPLDIHVTY